MKNLTISVTFQASHFVNTFLRRITSENAMLFFPMPRFVVVELVEVAIMG